MEHVSQEPHVSCRLNTVLLRVHGSAVSDLDTRYIQDYLNVFNHEYCNHTTTGAFVQQRWCSFRALVFTAVLTATSITTDQAKHPTSRFRTGTALASLNLKFSAKVFSWQILKLSLLQPLTGLQSNGQGLRYRVMWRQKTVDSDWTSVTVSNNSRFIVSGTPTFVPYELKVQAMNDYGAGPEPAIARGYSGEDCELDWLFRLIKRNITVCVCLSLSLSLGWNISLCNQWHLLSVFAVVFSCCRVPCPLHSAGRSSRQRSGGGAEQHSGRGALGSCAS